MFIIRGNWRGKHNSLSLMWRVDLLPFGGDPTPPSPAREAFNQRHLPTGLTTLTGYPMALSDSRATLARSTHRVPIYNAQICP